MVLVRHLLIFSILLLFPLFVVQLSSGEINNDEEENDIGEMGEDEVHRDGIDTVVVFTAADSVIYQVNKKKMSLYGSGALQYRDMELTAARIYFEWDRSELFAEGVPLDTVIGEDVTGRSVKQFYTGLPVMRYGYEEYEGFTIAYNFDTKRGRMTYTDTEVEDGYYHGNTVKRMENEVLYLADGWYTTCDNPDHPHYYFYSPKMRIVPKSSVAAAPIYLYISDVPVFAIPFGVFPAQSGRRSGLLAPTYGQSARHGRFLTGIGYYWATSDYMDWTGSFDFYSKGRWKVDSNFRYSLRYNFDGMFTASTSRTAIGEPGDPDRFEQRDYRFFLMHNQEINPTSRVDVNFTYMTADYYQTTSLDFEELYRTRIQSNATYYKRWEQSNNSMTINVNREHDLSTDEEWWTLPDISFNRTISYPFRRSGTGVNDQRWYETIGYTYSTNIQNRIATTLQFDPAIHQFIDEGVNGSFFGGVNGDTSFVTDYNAGANHRIGVTATQRGGFITYQPFFGYTELWYNERIQRHFDEEVNQVVTEAEQGFFPVRFFSTGISFQTTIYGMFRPTFGNIDAIRHTVTPNVTYTYNPDFSASWWGYYDEYFDSSIGKTVKYSLYDGQLFGTAPAARQQQVNFSVGNLFEMKRIIPGEGEDDERTYQLLNLTVSSSYNFAADSLKMAPLRVSFRTTIGQFSISGASVFDVYTFDTASERRVNRLQYNETGSLLRFLNFNVSVSTSLKGGARREYLHNYGFADMIYPMNPYNNMRRYYYYERPSVGIPWDVSLSWDFGYDESNPNRISRRSNIRAALSLNLTEKWNVSASSGYDIITGRFTDPGITITRDLHCWNMYFFWVPTGFNQQYRLEIRVNAAHLSDLKVSKRGSVREVY